MGRARGFKFSLLSLLLFVLFGASAASLWLKREPWVFLHVLQDHEDWVECAEFSPDGTRIVTASHDGDARVWESNSGRGVVVLKGSHSLRLTSVAFSPDGKKIVTVSWDKCARLWDSFSGQLLTTLEGHNKSVRCAAFSPDGKKIVTTSDDQTARVWDVEWGRQLLELSGHTNFVFGAAFSRDGKRIVTCGDTTVQLWNAETGALISKHTLEESTLTVEFAPDGRSYVTTGAFDAAYVWDGLDGHLIATLGQKNHNPDYASYSPDSKRIVTAGMDGTARIWEAATGRELAVMSGHKDGVESAVYSPDGLRIATGDTRNVRIWNAADGALLAVLSEHTHVVNTVRFSPDSRRIVTASCDHTSEIWVRQRDETLLGFAVMPEFWIGAVTLIWMGMLWRKRRETAK